MEEIKKVSERLIRLRQLDQENINLVTPDNGKTKAYTEEVRKLVNQYGLITISQFGEMAAHSAWLIIQHSNHDIKLQERYLELMERSLAEVIPEDYARLVDRVRINKGLEQVYGTQFDPKTFSIGLEPFPVEDPKNLDRRRAGLGLTSFAKYREAIVRKYSLREPTVS